MSGRGDDAAWCAADPHFTEGDAALPAFHLWLDAFGAQGPQTLVLLGDLFSAWTALPAALAPHQRAVLDHLGALARGGRRLVFVVGNRDYFAESLSPAPFFAVGDRWDLALPCGDTVRFEHGDLVNASDRNYQRWRLVSRMAAVEALVRALPGSLQRRLAERLERAMGPTNRAYKERFPAQELARWARGARADGVTAAALGHFHEDRELEVEGVRVRLAPQFREGGEHLALRPDGTFEARTLALLN